MTAPTSSTPSGDEFPIIRRLYGLILPYRATVWWGLLCLVLSVAAELYPPLVWQRVVDVGLARRDWGYIVGQLVLLVAVFGVGQIFSAIRGVLLERAGQQLTYDLRLRLYRSLQAQSLHFYSNRRTGDLLSRLTTDVENVQDVLVKGTDSILANALRIIGVAAIFIYLQPTLGLLTLVPMILVGVFLRHYNQRVRPVYRAARDQLGLMSAKLADNLGGMRVVQSFAQERREEHEIGKLGKYLFEQQVDAVKLRNRVFPFIRWIANFGNVIMLGGGIWFIMRGQFTIGGLLAYRGYGRYFYGPIDDLVNINDLVQRAAAAGRRIFEVLDTPSTITDAPGSTPLPTPIRGAVRFENVSFGYDPARPVLRDIDLDIRPGERVAILGPSGAGKSTLLALVARSYDPVLGRVVVDGHDLRDVTLASLRSQIAQVQQETFLFTASALENLRYGRPDASMDDVVAATRAANAHAFLSALPQGYDTLVGERGVRLSGGQRQRLAVARALLVQAPLLLLDEPTSAVEPESEALIVQALERLMEGRTTLIVSHRLSLARSADRVVIVADGRIVEQGAPDDLLALPDSAFSAMVRADSIFDLAQAEDHII
jgi:ABC-type multidrug transport system fused ATPase/permease subunit